MLPDARTAVKRATEQASAEDDARISGSAGRLAVKRTIALRRHTGLRRFAYQNGLVLVFTGLFLLSFVGQVLTGRAEYNEEQRTHGKPAASLRGYLGSGAFLEATAENWESEFLQMALFVVLTVFLYQRGSSESKDLTAPEAVDQRPEEARDDPRAPWPVRRGGVPLALYKHSLSIALFAMFAVSFVLHAVGGAIEYSETQVAHGGQPVSTMGYLATSRFWFESLQNWQSEFMSVAMLVLLTIWLREQGSPQSKPVASPSSNTGE
ncbi:MAG TPA: DUF6766 family protein [Gemmatimonas sp.]|nr:DUF6766 family protein [Gemmatimonas sp.]